MLAFGGLSLVENRDSDIVSSRILWIEGSACSFRDGGLPANVWKAGASVGRWRFSFGVHVDLYHVPEGCYTES